MNGQQVLALVRDTDPGSSVAGAARAHVESQRATILRLLLAYETGFGHECVSVNADLLYDRFPFSQRSVWSSRLSGMASCDPPLLTKDRDTNPVSFKLAAAGRRAAEALR